MNATTLLVVIIGLTVFGYVIGRMRSIKVSQGTGGPSSLHSLPKYYGYMVALWCGIPALILLVLWLVLEPGILRSLLLDELPTTMSTLSENELSLVMNDLQLLADSGRIDAETDPHKKAAAIKLLELNSTSELMRNVLIFLVALNGIIWGLANVKIDMRARVFVERIIRYLLILCSLVAILTTIGIVLSVLFESIRFFKSVPITDFIFGTEWSPQTAIRADQVGSSGAFGAIPLFAGTLLISAIALIIAVPTGLMSAIYLSEYASRRFRAVAKPLLEILAGIPTVVYGFFAALTVAPFIRKFGESIGLNVASESALAAGVVMGIMIIPFVSSLSDDVISAVPKAMRDGAYGMGATQSETIRQVLIPAALPGIVGGILLAASRAIGETMIVVMAAGLAANLTVNPLQAVTTVTVQIVTLLTGDQEFDSPKTLAAFALGLMLFVTTLVLNVIALHIVRKYREQYE
ncbi:MAG: phosphate ABC transporter permease subunit PstC [Gammaproteobacteria bacterium]|nr:phosphate ABC transporter permease subunit PstC [Gammaproteobacteria bacterium]